MGGDPFIGRSVIGQYLIKERLGSGGMGAVYLAEQVTVSRRAVIKVLHPRLHGAPDVAARFAVEAKAASNLEHPNIVTIYNYGEMEDGTLFLAMEYLEGKTLGDLLMKQKHHRLPLERALAIAKQIANALGEAHRRRVIHRDLKPSNVMLVERAGTVDFVKVLDFGIAKLEGASMTSTGEVFGTPRYMSPEQLRGAPLDGRSDLYSAGLLLYEMLAGRSPFESDTPQGWMFKHISEPPPPPSEVSRRLKLPAAVEAVVLRALAKTPDERPATMESFASGLDAAMRAPVEVTTAPVRTRAPRKRAKKAPRAKPAVPRTRQAKSWLAGLARQRSKRPRGWRAVVGSMRGKIALAAITLAVIGIVTLAAMSWGGESVAATARPASVAKPAKPAPVAAPVTKPAKKRK